MLVLAASDKLRKDAWLRAAVEDDRATVVNEVSEKLEKLGEVVSAEIEAETSVKPVDVTSAELVYTDLEAVMVNVSEMLMDGHADEPIGGDSEELAGDDSEKLVGRELTTSVGTASLKL